MGGEYYILFYPSHWSRFRDPLYKYPKLVQNSDFGYASPEILIELNTFTNPEPHKALHLNSLIGETLVQNSRHDLAELHNLKDFKINVLSVERTLVEKILCLVKTSHESNTAHQLSKKIRHFFDIEAILQHKKYQDFISGNTFAPLIQNCILDEKALGLESAKCLDSDLRLAPLFSNFEQWEPLLTRVYENDFTDLVYGHLPDIGDIKDTLQLIKENLK